MEDPCGIHRPVSERPLRSFFPATMGIDKEDVMRFREFRIRGASCFLGVCLIPLLPLAAQEPRREVEVERRIERRQIQGPDIRAPREEVIRRRIRERAGFRQGPGPGGMIPPDVQREIGLSEEQRRKMQDIRFNSEKARIQGEASLQVLQMELRRLMEGDAPDRGAIDRKIQEISQAQAALMRARVNGELDHRSVLTKEQRDKLRELMQNREAARPPLEDQPGPPPELERARPRQVPPSAPRP